MKDNTESEALIRKEIQIRINKIKKIKRKIKDLNSSIDHYESEIKDLEEEIVRLNKN